jgi:hypothetical protein
MRMHSLANWSKDIRGQFIVGIGLLTGSGDLTTATMLIFDQGASYHGDKVLAEVKTYSCQRS